ncbi:helix-turn-helix transcriptional regulator [Mycolicibacterium gadium]|uniref:helix-turn-helix transcriptional regulator n=1 Tax=Mycolicibacterium gadium TaxID=1794 RepID=UPI0027E33C97|nr:DNA-binding protein [Mycolicibacterium gadium]
MAEYLRTTVAALAQLRYRGTGPKFLSLGRRVLYRWADVEAWLAESLRNRTGE